MPQSKLDIYPGGASAYQSPFDVGAVGPGGGVFDFSGILARQLAMREKMQEAQLQQMRQQMQIAQDRARLESQYQRRQLADPGYKKQLGVNQSEKRLNDIARAAHSLGSIGGPKISGRDVNWGTAADRGLASPHLMAAAGINAPTGRSMAGPMPDRLVGPAQMRAKGIGAGEPAYGPYSYAEGLRGDVDLSPYAENVYSSTLGIKANKDPYYGYDPEEPLYSYEKGGRVPKTGTYKLHEREVVVPAKVADVMFPYVQPGGPPKSKGRARKSYQEGTGAVEMLGLGNYPEQLGRALGYGANQVGQAIGAGIGAIGDIGGQAISGFQQGYGSEPTALEPTPERPPMDIPMPEAAPDREVGPPMLEVGAKGPETDRDRLSRLRDEADKADKNADYHDAKLQTIMSYASGDPSRWTPAMKKLIQQRQAVAKQYRQREAEYNKRAEQLESKLIESETVKEATATEAQGRQSEAAAQLQTRAAKDTDERIQGLFARIATHMKNYGVSDPDAMRASISAELSPMMYPALLAQAQGATQEERFAQVQQTLNVILDAFEKDPVDALGFIRQALMASYGG